MREFKAVDTELKKREHLKGTDPAAYAENETFCDTVQERAEDGGIWAAQAASLQNMTIVQIEARTTDLGKRIDELQHEIDQLVITSQQNPRQETNYLKLIYTAMHS